MNLLVKKIKEKKELSDVSDEVVVSTLADYLNKHRISMPKSEKEIKKLKKKIRKKLRKCVGRFQVKINQNERAKLLEENKIDEILQTHSSTKERLEIYGLLIEKIKEINPKSILDLGCGINPLIIAKAFLKVRQAQDMPRMKVPFSRPKMIRFFEHLADTLRPSIFK